MMGDVAVIRRVLLGVHHPVLELYSDDVCSGMCCNKQATKKKKKLLLSCIILAAPQ